MSKMYERIDSLCKENSLTVSKMCKELSITRSCLSELNSGRTDILSTKNTNKIASFFNVSVDYLMGKTDKKSPTVQDSGDELINGDAELTEYLEELKNRDEMRMLFKLAKGATKEDVERAVAIIEALRGKNE